MRIIILFSLIVLACYLLWSVGFISERTRNRQALLDISRIKHSARLFRADHGRCPDNLEELAAPPGDTIYLVEYKDPWGQPYKLICPSRTDPGGVDVLSGGPDRTFGGRDTISSL
jgi:hypothetical protein